MFNGDMFVFSKGSPYIFASRTGIVKLSIFNVKHYKKKDFVALNFRLAVNMLQLIYALKKHNCLPCPAFRFIAEITFGLFFELPGRIYGRVVTNNPPEALNHHP
jgi:hypothetical protein